LWNNVRKPQIPGNDFFDSHCRGIVLLNWSTDVTDRRTDGQAIKHSVLCNCMLSRVKNCTLFCFGTPRYAKGGVNPPPSPTFKTVAPPLHITSSAADWTRPVYNTRLSMLYTVISLYIRTVAYHHSSTKWAKLSDHFTFLLVTHECIHKILWFLANIYYIMHKMRWC